MKLETKKLLGIVSVAGMLSGCSSGESSLSVLTSSSSLLVESSMCQNADKYIQENKDSVNEARRNAYHAMPPIGWCNDPNGWSEYDGRYQLFYQYNPYSAVWGPMHWGHLSSSDFIKWDLEKVALAPDEDYDQNGCFSGNALVDDGRLILAYTSVDGDGNQNQSLAYSYDGSVFTKIATNPVIGKSLLPSGFDNQNFRDPKIFARDGKYFILAGNKDDSTGAKQIITFAADDPLGPYSYLGQAYGRNDIGGIFECPGLMSFGDDDFLIASPQGIKGAEKYLYQNADSCVYLHGHFSTNTGHFLKDQNVLEEFDKGFSFYAPETMETSDGRTILIAWMRSWAEPNSTQGDGWCGAMTLPRSLTYKDGHIYQSPIKEINNYLKDTITLNDFSLNDEDKDTPSFYGNKGRVSFTLNLDSLASSEAGVKLLQGGKYYTKVYYDKADDLVVFDRENCGGAMSGKRYCKLPHADGKIKFEIFLDVNSIEVFLNDGYYTMTGTTFSDPDNDGLSFYSVDGLASFEGLSHSDIVVA